MNHNFQAIDVRVGVIASMNDALFCHNLIAVQEFHTELMQVLADARFGRLITLLEDGAYVAQFDEDAWWTIVDDLKGHLGSQWANSVGDSCDDQQSTLDAADEWVEENISNATRAKVVATGVVLYGFARMESMIHELGFAITA